ncbi:hypothetical protein N431DRAFT_356598 [Stipitochalara longipes BDJ]|nr:hypothetical protein N431DRAFT_356598 [Stipitochalara longipes BDJ]
MEQKTLETVPPDDSFDFSGFVQTRFRDSSILNPLQYPANDFDRRSIADVLEEIDRVSVQGILVRTILTHVHDEFSKHAAAVCRTFHTQPTIDTTYALWVQEATGEPAVGAIDTVKGKLESISPAALRSLLLEGVLIYSDAAAATLGASNAMSPALSTALSEIEEAYQSCLKMLQKTRRLVACQCVSDHTNEEFLESCCETKSQITARKEHLHVTVRTIGRAAELTPAWETRRDALRALDKLYWKCKSWNVFLQDGEEGTDEVRSHVIDSIGGLAENMGPAERQRYLDEGFNFKVLESLEGKVYEALKDLKRAADNLRANLTQNNMKDSILLSESQKSNLRTENTKVGEKHMSDVAGIRKAETKRLKRRRAKDRKALEKALGSLGL